MLLGRLLLALRGARVWGSIADVQAFCSCKTGRLAGDLPTSEAPTAHLHASCSDLTGGASLAAHGISRSIDH